MKHPNGDYLNIRKSWITGAGVIFVISVLIAIPGLSDIFIKFLKWIFDPLSIHLKMNYILHRDVIILITFLILSITMLISLYIYMRKKIDQTSKNSNETIEYQKNFAVRSIIALSHLDGIYENSVKPIENVIYHTSDINSDNDSEGELSNNLEIIISPLIKTLNDQICRNIKDYFENLIVDLQELIEGQPVSSNHHDVEISIKFFQKKVEFRQESKSETDNVYPAFVDVPRFLSGVYDSTTIATDKKLTENRHILSDDKNSLKVRINNNHTQLDAPEFFGYIEITKKHKNSNIQLNDNLIKLLYQITTNMCYYLNQACILINYAYEKDSDRGDISQEDYPYHVLYMHFYKERGVKSNANI